MPPYGLLLFRDPSGSELALIDATDDSAFEFVRRWASDRAQVESRDRARIVQGLFGAICDRPSDGTHWSAERVRKCPQCGADVRSFEMTARVVEREVPTMTHHGWDHLSADEKNALLVQLSAPRAR